MFSSLTNLSLSSKFVLFLLAVVLVVLIPNLSQISEKLGFETTNSLRKKIEILKSDKERLEENEKVLKKEIEIEKQKAKDLEETLKINENNKTVIKQTVVKYVKVLSPKPTPPTKTNAPDGLLKATVSEKTPEELSLENITTIWKAYCEIHNVANCPV